MTRCRYCAGPVPDKRAKLRGRRPNYCSNTCHERDLLAERAAVSGWRRALLKRIVR